MKKNIGLRFLGIIGVVILSLGIFLPYVSNYGYSESLFSIAEKLYYYPYILLGLGFFSLITLLINKKSEIGFLLVGSVLAYVFPNTMELKDYFDKFSYGYYMLVGGTLLLFVALLFMPVNKEKDSLAYTQNRSTDYKNDNDNMNNNINYSNSYNNMNNSNSYNNMNDSNMSYNNDPVNNSLSGYNIYGNYGGNSNYQNNQPSQFAESIMNQPVMKNLQNESFYNNNDNNNSVSGMNTINQIDNSMGANNSIINNQNNTLDSNNPLNSFLQNNLGSSEGNNTEIKQEKKISTNDNVQSIMTIMEQPMVDNQISSSVPEQPIVTSGQTVLVQDVVQQPIPQIIPEQSIVTSGQTVPVQDVVQQPIPQTIPEQPVVTSMQTVPVQNNNNF